MTSFGLFATGRAVSLMGSAMSPAALALAVLTASGRPADLGVVLAAQIVPHLLFLLVGGTMADRFPRRTVLIVSHLGSGLVQLAVAAMLLTGSYSLPLVAGLAMLGGALDGSTTPALRGIVGELVPHSGMQRANAVLAAVKNLTKILGPTVAGLLVATVGGGWAVAIDAASFLIAAGLLAGLRLPQAPQPVRRASLLRDIRTGWDAFGAMGWLWPTTLCFCAINLVSTGSWQILGPALVHARHGDLAWGVVLSVRAAGLFTASAVLYRITLRHPLRVGQTLGTLGGIALIAIGLDANLPTLVSCAFIGGLGFASIGIAWEAAFQHHVPRDVISRVSANNDLLSYLTIPLGQLLTAPAATVWGSERVMTVSGTAFAIAAAAPLAARSVRNLTAGEG